MESTEISICRACTGGCPIAVTIEDGRAIKVEGDPNAPLFGGYSCRRGRVLPDILNNPGRLKHSMIRGADGSLRPAAAAELVEDIAQKLSKIIAKYGPNSVAVYAGAGGSGGAFGQLAASLGSSMYFTATTIDMPNMMIAPAFHGEWAGGRTHSSTWDVFVLIGTNPIVSKQYHAQNPGQKFKKMVRNGTKFIVIDPRRTETARRAHIHLQIIPGEDAVVLAGLVHLLIANDCLDHEFIAENAEGLEALAEAVRPFTPVYVAERAGITVEDLLEAARVIGEARSGDIALGVGPSMATRGNIAAYLSLCLQTLRGHWAREGAIATYPSVLVPRKEFKAQPLAPRPVKGFGRKLRVRGLEETVAGLPTGALPEEILMPGEGQIKALFMGGGAMVSFPQQRLVKQALDSLELCVVCDVEVSPTARVSTHVFATHMPLEMAAHTGSFEVIRFIHPGYGYEEPYANYTAAVVAPPPDAELISPFSAVFRIAKAMGISLLKYSGEPMDMDNEPTADELVEMSAAGSRIPLSEVKKYPGGHIFEEANEIVQRRDLDCVARLQLAAPEMMQELSDIREESIVSRRKTDAEFAYLLIPRRMPNTFNANFRHAPGPLSKPHNPAFLHPSELEKLGLIAGDLVEIRSRHGMIVGVVESDADLRAGVLSMQHSFGRVPGERTRPREDGANTNALLRMDDDYDPYSGMPRMGAVPVSIRRAPADCEDMIA